MNGIIKSAGWLSVALIFASLITIASPGQQVSAFEGQYPLQGRAAAEQGGLGSHPPGQDGSGQEPTDQPPPPPPTPTPVGTPVLRPLADSELAYNDSGDLPAHFELRDNNAFACWEAKNQVMLLSAPREISASGEAVSLVRIDYGYATYRSETGQVYILPLLVGEEEPETVTSIQWQEREDEQPEIVLIRDSGEMRRIDLEPLPLQPNQEVFFRNGVVVIDHFEESNRIRIAEMLEMAYDSTDGAWVRGEDAYRYLMTRSANGDPQEYFGWEKSTTVGSWAFGRETRVLIIGWEKGRASVIDNQTGQLREIRLNMLRFVRYDQEDNLIEEEALMPSLILFTRDDSLAIREGASRELLREDEIFATIYPSLPVAIQLVVKLSELGRMGIERTYAYPPDWLYREVATQYMILTDRCLISESTIEYDEPLEILWMLVIPE